MVWLIYLLFITRYFRVLNLESECEYGLFSNNVWEFVWRYKWVESLVDLSYFVSPLIACLLFAILVKLDFTYVIYIELDWKFV